MKSHLTTRNPAYIAITKVMIYVSPFVAIMGVSAFPMGQVGRISLLHSGRATLNAIKLTRVCVTSYAALL